MENNNLFQNKHMSESKDSGFLGGNSNNSSPVFNDEKLEKEFRDLEGLTIKKLKIGLWFVERKDVFKKALLYLLIATSVISWGYTIISVIYYFAVGMRNDDLMINQLVKKNSAGLEYLQSVSAQELSISRAAIFDLGNGKYDFVTSVANQNKDYYAEFLYTLEIGGQAVEQENGFVLPGESKYLMFLGKEQTYRPTNASIGLSNITWHRINRHQISDWDDYKNSHLNFAIDSVNFVGSRDTGILQAAGLNNLEFEVTNKTPYNYWLVNFPIILYSNSNIVAINRYGVSEFMSGSTKKIKMSWPGSFDRVTNITIIPDLDIMADDIYIKFQGDTSKERQ